MEILALPYYGSLWVGSLQQSGNNVINTSTFEKPLTYSEIRKKFRKLSENFQNSQFYFRRFAISCNQSKSAINSNQVFG